MVYKILVINLGSTSTKIAIFENENQVLEKTFRHELSEILAFPTSIAQKDYRKKHITNFFKENNLNFSDIDVFVGRGGLIKPVTGGTYLVNPVMIEELSTLKYGDHVCNLGAILAYEYANPFSKRAFIVDPVVVDELKPVARVSGYKGIERRSTFHALNQKAVAKKYAEQINKPYENLNLIVVHMGGGISIGLHEKGRVVDVNNALGGEGPFSPQRAGTLPFYDVMDLTMESSDYQELKKILVTKGGLYSYLGTNSGSEIVKRIEKGNQEANFYLDAMVYQIMKNIGSLYFVAQGNIDAVIFTGGLIYEKEIEKRLDQALIKSINRAFYPGEGEMTALASGALRVLMKKEVLKIYK